jgi:hypothetical protein
MERPLLTRGRVSSLQLLLDLASTASQVPRLCTLLLTIGYLCVLFWVLGVKHRPRRCHLMTCGTDDSSAGFSLVTLY